MGEDVDGLLASAVDTVSDESVAGIVSGTVAIGGAHERDDIANTIDAHQASLRSRRMDGISRERGNPHFRPTRDWPTIGDRVPGTDAARVRQLETAFILFSRFYGVSRSFPNETNTTAVQ